MTQAKLVELEAILEDCQKFLELVPLEALNKGLVWMPSETAIALGRVAKNSLNRYASQHLHGMGNL